MKELMKAMTMKEIIELKVRLSEAQPLLEKGEADFEVIEKEINELAAQILNENDKVLLTEMRQKQTSLQYKASDAQNLISYASEIIRECEPQLKFKEKVYESILEFSEEA